MREFSYVYEVTLGEHGESVTAIEFSPDGRHLASGSEDGILLIYSTIDWKPIRRFIDASPLTALTWQHSGQYIFCGFESGDIHTIRFDPSKVNSDREPPGRVLIPAFIDSNGRLDRFNQRANPIFSPSPDQEGAHPWDQ